MNSNAFRYFFILSIAIVAILVSIGFARLEKQQTEQNTFARTLHSLILTNQALSEAAVVTATNGDRIRTEAIGQLCKTIETIPPTPAKSKELAVNFRKCQDTLAKAKANLALAIKLESEQKAKGVREDKKVKVS